MTKRYVVHIEIPATDAQKAGEFYKSLFGWEIQAIPDGNTIALYTSMNPEFNQ